MICIGYVHCTLYKYPTVYTVHCTVYSVHCTVYSVHCTGLYIYINIYIHFVIWSEEVR